MNKDVNFILQATIVSSRSTCPRRQVGCVIVDVNGFIMSTGFNGVPRGRPHCTMNPCEAADAPSGTSLDLCLAIHAEQNALMQCRDIMNIGSIYITHSPCMHCAKMIANTSVNRVFYNEEYSHAGAVTFLESCEIEVICLSTKSIGQEVRDAERYAAIRTS